MMLLIDVGGSNTRVAVSEREGNIGNPVIFPTEKDFDTGINKIAETAAALLHNEKPEAVVMGITGQVSKAGELLKSPNLSTWEDRDLKNVLFERFDAPAYVLNDAQLGAVGEATAGAGKGASVVLYMTLGTGIGFARTIEGQPDLTIGSETGHQYIDIDGEHLVEAEDVVSGRALKEKLHVGGEDVHDPMVWEEYARLAAIPLYNAILAYAPDAVVVGGSLVKEGSLSVSKLAEHVEKIATHLTHMPSITHATLGDLCGLYGAQAYGRTKLS
jgi:glucokinase